MADRTAEFFAELAQRSHEPRLAGFTGSVRFDLVHDGEVDHWFLDIAKGDLTVSNHDGPADAIISGDRTVIDGVIAGDVNPVAATLRGVLTIAGDWDLIFLCQRLFGSARVTTGGSTQ
jgi:putative sterol carrier protein